MSEAYVVDIDIDLLAANVGKGEGRPVSTREVQRFLQEQGFIL